MTNPRLLLFGTPGAGKSSLLAAFDQAAPAFKAELIDQTKDLQRYQLKRDKGADPHSQVTILDCSGKSALAMLQAKDPFAGAQAIQKPILDADAVMLVVDASLSGQALTDEFRQVTRWLEQLHEFRGRRADVAELPVYLVLAKCDLLAKKDDTFREWLERIDDRKSQIGASFRAHLTAQGVGFGTIKLQISATATKRPAFADKPAKTQEPFGVTELFTESMRSATDFHERRQTSQSRLQNVVAGLAGLVVLLALSVFVLIEYPPPTRSATLEERVQTLLPGPNASAEVRLQGTIKKLEDKQKTLADVLDDAGFMRLPTETQNAALSYSDELAKYLQMNQQSQAILKLPHLAKNDAELKELTKNVQAFALPASYAKDWEPTRLGQRVHHVRQEYELLGSALKDEETWVRGQIEKNQILLKTGNSLYGKLLNQEKDAPDEAKQWYQQYREQMRVKSPNAGDDRVPGVSRILYDDLAKFEPVRTAQKDWKSSKDNLTSISDLIQKKLRSGS